MEADTEIHRVCRACLIASEKPMVHMCESPGGSESTATGITMDMYTQCTSLPLDPFDTFTKYMCHNCYGKLTEYFAFRQQCIETYHQLTEQKIDFQYEENLIADVKHTPSEAKIVFTYDEIDKSKQMPSQPANGIAQSLCHKDFGYPEGNDDAEEDKYLIPNECEEVYLDNSDNIEDVVIPNNETDTHVKRSAVEQGVDTKFTCDMCQRCFARKHRLKIHMRHHVTQDDQKEYRCEYDGCDKIYTIKVRVTYACSLIPRALTFDAYVFFFCLFWGFSVGLPQRAHTEKT